VGHGWPDHSQREYSKCPLGFPRFQNSLFLWLIIRVYSSTVPHSMPWICSRQVSLYSGILWFT
jgi:hypothetical protein